MKEITLKIPNKKVDFVIELFNQLGLEIVEESEIPEAHKSIVRDRIVATKAEDMVPWEEARNKLTIKASS
jgi:hypothetical protein